ncbi:MAG: DUF2029 domain-containing protein [Chloroflexi bacterium]|nr:DUF2029 domain-containing protein [Chloroflexota bacterium]MDL1882098.1 DUF2029 domain-containing protein [Anaerolineae bacterium CFX8]
MIESRSQKLILALVALVVFAVVVVGIRSIFTAKYPGLNDFMSRWEGARSYWIDGLNPYGEQASLNIQTRIYGRAVVEGEDPGYFAYPFYTVFLVWPLVYLPYSWASAAWMALLAACLIGSLLLLLNLLRWQPGAPLLAALALWALFFYFSARGMILGQPGTLVVFLEILAIWGLARGQNRLAGAALALSTIKPQMGFLVAPFLLLWGWRARRWSFLAAFAAVFGAALLASFALLPSWLGDWLAQLSLYPSYTALGSPVWIVTQYYLGLGSLAEYAVTAALAGWMLWAWWGVLAQKKDARLLWTLALTLTVTHLIAPRTATPHYVVFFLPLVFYFSRLARQRWGGLWVALLLAALVLLPWLHFVTTVAGEFEHPTLYLPLPFGILLLLWPTRRMWWRFGGESAV